MAGVRHVWVRPEFVPVELPGLLLEWRNDADGWRGLVCYGERDGRLVTQWLPAANLRLAKSSPRTGSAYG